MEKSTVAMALMNGIAQRVRTLLQFIIIKETEQGEVNAET